MNNKVTILLLTIMFISCALQEEEKKSNSAVLSEVKEDSITNLTNKVLLYSDVVWEKLNPARGEKSPQAGTLWGNRKSEVPTGFLAKFIDGFSSPPHIHNATYRAVVIKGSIHNDDPAAEKLWMKPVSFWTQPAGESHITAAKGSENIALVEIDKGPYLVKPISEAFDNGERPVNIDVSNLIWLDGNDIKWISKKSNISTRFLWEETSSKNKGLFLKVPANSKGKIVSSGNVFHGVVIKGILNYDFPKDQMQVLESGSYFGAIDRAEHKIENNTTSEVIIYIRTNGEIVVK